MGRAGAGLETDQPRLELVLLADPSAAGSGYTGATVPAPVWAFEE